MTDADRKAFLEGLTAVALLFEKELSPVVIELYFRALERFPLEQVSLALSQCVHTCTFMPKPAEIIKAIEGSTEDKVEHMITEARAAGRRFGYRNPPVMPAALERSIRSVFGGWEGFCHADFDTYQQHRFREALTGNLESEHIIGLPELTQVEAVALLEETRVRTRQRLARSSVVERRSVTPDVAGSSPAEPATFDPDARITELQEQARRLRDEAS